MILADKILTLRKNCGWSQEELAEKLGVSRQSISKWEGAAAIPDMNKILDMSNLFGVSTDYLLKDDVVNAEYSGKDDAAAGVSLGEAQDYISASARSGKRIALGVTLCILSPVPLLLLVMFAMTDKLGFRISEGVASGAGVTVLLLMVATAVALFITDSVAMARFDYLKRGPFELEYGVSGIVKEARDAFAGKYTASLVIGVGLCILCSVPLIMAGAMGAEDYVCVALTAFLLVMVAVGVHLLISSGCRKESFDVLLSEGEYAPGEREKTEKNAKIGGIYWPIVTAGYLAWSFISNDWHITWLVWPVAGVLFAAISAVVRSFSRK